MAGVLVALYFGAGLIFAPIFVWRGAAAIDDDAVAGSWGFRFLILPGAAVLWPLLAAAWLRARRGAESD